MASIGLAVGGAAAASPETMLRLFGIDRREVTGAAAFGWRMFAVRTLVISLAAVRGSQAAREAFLPVQVLDQMVFAHAGRTGAIPRRAAAMAMGTSGAIIALDLTARARRRGASPAST